MRHGIEVIIRVDYYKHLFILITTWEIKIISKFLNYIKILSEYINLYTVTIINKKIT
jgi:hypothetical protein